MIDWFQAEAKRLEYHITMQKGEPLNVAELLSLPSLPAYLRCFDRQGQIPFNKTCWLVSKHLAIMKSTLIKTCQVIQSCKAAQANHWKKSTPIILQHGE